MMFRCVIACLSLSIASYAHAEDASEIFHQSGLPIPRFVSLKSGKINMRIGPGKHYPISWVYKRKQMPVEVVEEFGHWRKTRDIEGTEGWIRSNLLSGTRTALIKEQRRPLFVAPDLGTKILIEVDPLVPGAIEQCTLKWCQLTFDNFTGWAPKDYIWGVYDNEVIESD